MTLRVTPVTRARLRGGAILAALKNGKTIDLTINPRMPCVAVPPGCDRLRLATRMSPPSRLKVSGLGLHADITHDGCKHHVTVPWHAIVRWSAK